MLKTNGCGTSTRFRRQSISDKLLPSAVVWMITSHRLVLAVQIASWNRKGYFLAAAIIAPGFGLPSENPRRPGHCALVTLSVPRKPTALLGARPLAHRRALSMVDGES